MTDKHLLNTQIEVQHLFRVNANEDSRRAKEKHVLHQILAECTLAWCAYLHTTWLLSQRKFW